MQMQSTYWLEKVLKMISLYGNALLCTLQHMLQRAQKRRRAGFSWATLYMQHTFLHISCVFSIQYAV